MKIQITKKQNVFFCSDPHYHHSSLVRGTSNWEDKSPCRDFDTLEEHDNTLVNNINNTVDTNDILFCLGDWNFGQYKDSVRLAKEFRSRINCKTLHLILGNHDKHIARNKEGVQGIFTTVGNYREVLIIDEPVGQKVKAIKTHVVLSHYAHRVWNKSHRGAFMLYGHSHNTLDAMTPEIANPTWIGDDYYIKNYRTIDVGFDTHKEFRPYSWQEIKEIMKNKNVELEIDHHGKERD